LTECKFGLTVGRVLLVADHGIAFTTAGDGIPNLRNAIANQIPFGIGLAIPWLGTIVSLSRNSRRWYPEPSAIF
jgi:hypothetical protein